MAVVGGKTLRFVDYKYTALIHILPFVILCLRDDFKTQPPVDRRFWPVFVTTRNRTEPSVNWRLGSEVAP